MNKEGKVNLGVIQINIEILISDITKLYFELKRLSRHIVNNRDHEIASFTRKCIFQWMVGTY